jgi:hypothetical protein
MSPIGSGSSSNSPSLSSIESLPSKQYVLVVNDDEYLFYGSEISRDYLLQLWDTLDTNKSQLPKVTAILTTAEQLKDITSKDAYTTPLADNGYLILTTSFKQLRERLRFELALVNLDCYIDSLEGEDLLTFPREVDALALCMGVTAPKLIAPTSGVV